MTLRREAECEECHEVRALATTTECFRCYRARKRADEAAVVDRHNPGLRKEHQKLLNGYHKVMSGLRELGAERKYVLEVRRIIAPYTAPIQWALSGEDDSPREQVAGNVHVHQPADTVQVNIHDQCAQ